MVAIGLEGCYNQERVQDLQFWKMVFLFNDVNVTKRIMVYILVMGMVTGLGI